MNRSVYKYCIEVKEGPQLVEMPVDARIVHVGYQGNQICIWAIVYTDPNVSVVTKIYEVVGTGMPIPRPSQYLATVVMGWYVWHVFRLEQ